MKQHTRNWSDYNRNLIARGNITLWVSHDIILSKPTPTGKRGRPYQYSDKLIEAALTIKQVYRLSLRATQGMLTGLYQLAALSKPVPSYSQLCRRAQQLSITLLPKRQVNPHQAIDVVIDSTGLKVYGEGEWCTHRHGRHYQRSWRKVHLAIDPNTLAVHAYDISGAREQDSAYLAPLLQQIIPSIQSVTGDGAYDTFKCYDTVQLYQAKAYFPPPERARLSTETTGHKKQACPQAIAQRDQTLRAIRQTNKALWKKQVGYHRRSLVETTMYRLKQLFGDRLASKHQTTRQLDVALRCKALNRMLDMTLTA